jgi:polysaccharide pyruvyl transferase WcaK-like protein
MIHHVFANRSNIGDWLSARGIQSLLTPQPIVEHLCDEPFVDETLNRLALTGPADTIVIGGGGLFMDYFLPFWQGFREIAGRTPFFIWGVGYCDLKREMSRPPAELLTEIINQSRFCSVRDELTRRYLPECHLPPPSACPSLCVVQPAREGGCGVLHVDSYDNAGPDVYAFMDACALRFAESTQRPCRKTNNRIGQHHELTATLQRYALSDVVLSSALHGCIIGLAMGKKVVAVSGDRKIESFMQLVGLSEWICDLTEVKRVPELLDRILEQPTRQSCLNDLRERNKNIARRVLTTLFETAR